MARRSQQAMWNAKHGYVGRPYCKACSESFRSHLLKPGRTARNGCCRDAVRRPVIPHDSCNFCSCLHGLTEERGSSQPCSHCAKILAGFDRSAPQVFAEVDNPDRSLARRRQPPPPPPPGGSGSAGDTAFPTSKKIKVRSRDTRPFLALSCHSLPSADASACGAACPSVWQYLFKWLQIVGLKR